jgi:predicted acylesterase/phospholipase RssA
MVEGPADAVTRAEAFTEGGEASFEEIAALAHELREGRHFGPIAPMLITAGRRAIYDGWEVGKRVELAALLRGHQQFGYARRLLGRVRRDGGDSEYLRQQHALCTYKDMELPAARRLDRALGILEEGGPLERNSNAETLGLAGAIYKRRWEVDTKRADLESALWCYEQGYAQVGDPQREYAGINAAFVADQLAVLEDEGRGDSAEAKELRAVADRIRTEIAAGVPADDEWADATLGEALFGLGRFPAAQEHLARAGRKVEEPWKLESTAMQIAALGPLRGFDPEDVAAALKALLGEAGGAIQRASGKVGVALSGGGFRASLFHIGVLARLAECDLLRRAEVLSCVSGGSIVGAHYYLRLRELLERKPDGEIEGGDYVNLVRQLADEFLEGVRTNVRGHLITNLADDWRMLTSRYSRTDRAGELFEKAFFSKVPRGGLAPQRPWRMTDLYVTPRGTSGGFSLRYENWLREAKVPMLVLNATTLNTGHSWQFTAAWMGEPPVGVDERVDASRRLRRVYYRDTENHREPELGMAVAASACVPALFPPISLKGLYDDIDVELVDGGVHDNQGIASLLEQDCSVVLVSDASGQARDDEHPSRGLLGVASRSNSILMSRVRGAQYSELSDRRRSGVLRGLMVVHLKKGLPAPPHDWIGCREPYNPEDDALAPGTGSNRPDYGIDEEVQRALAELRTDLDSFSDEEAYSLMAAGYAMARYELPRALSGQGVEPSFEGTVSWPFADALKRLDDPSSRGNLLDALRPGHARFFRRIIAWRLRRRRRGEAEAPSPPTG